MDMKYMNLKHRKIFFNSGLVSQVMVYLMLFVVSCSEDRVGQNSVDGVPPSAISNVQIEPMPGGAKISYDLPEETALS